MDAEQEDRLQLMAQVQDLSGMVHSVRCYGVTALEQPEVTLTSLQQELRWLAQDLDMEQTQLAADAADLIAQLAADSRPALQPSGVSPAGSLKATAGTSDNAVEGVGCCKARSKDMEHNLFDDRAEGRSSADKEFQASSNMASCCESCTAKTVEVSAKHTAVDGLPLGSQRADACTTCEQSAPVCARSAQISAAATQAAGVAVAGCLVPAAIEQLLTRYPLAPPALQEQVGTAYALLLQQHAELQQRLVEGATRQRLTTPDKNGGWTADDHALFRRVQDLAESWQHQNSSFMKDSECMLREAHDTAAMAAEAAAVRLAWEAAGQLKHQELQGLRQQREQQQQV
eukprot:gene12926-13054_t